MRSVNKTETSTPSSTDQRELAALKAKAATNAERLKTATEVLAAAEKRRADLLLSDNFTVEMLSQANEKCSQAKGVLDGLTKLDADLAASIASAEKQITDARDKSERMAECAVIDQTVEAITGALNDFSASAELLSNLLVGKGVARKIHSGMQAGDGLRQTAGSVVAMVGGVVEEFCAVQRNVLNGSVAVPRPPGLTPPQPLIPKVELQGVFTLKTLRYRRGRESVVIEKFQQGELPVALAKFAIGAGYATVPEKGRGFRELASNTIAGTGVVVDLDAEMARAGQKTEAA
jgi:hypothetical protein